MKKIIPIVILLIFAGVGVYAYNFARPQKETIDKSGGPSVLEGESEGNESQEVDQEGQVEEDEKSEDSITGSVKDLLGMEKSIRCTWNANDGDSSIEGIVWVSGGKSRTDITVVTPEGEYESYFVGDGEYAYIWGPGQPGLKFTLEEMESGEMIDSEASEEEAAYEALSQEYEYKCDTWVVDEARFNVPGDVEFSDMTEMAQQMEQQVEEMSESLEGMCNSLPEPQKTECLNSMQE